MLFSEFCDAVEARGDHQHLLLLFRIGNHFAKSARFLRVLKPEVTSHNTEVICLPLRIYLHCMVLLSLPRVRDVSLTIAGGNDQLRLLL